MERKVSEILGKALESRPPSQKECVYLLGFPASSPEATFTRGVANDVARRKTGNTGLLFGQIGFELYPCQANCEFRAFGKSHTGFKDRVALTMRRFGRRRGILPRTATYAACGL
jgi:biotin synthase